MTKLKLARLEGQSTDGKPLKYAGGNTPVGAEYTELDTGRRYKFDGQKWNELTRTDEGKNWASKQPRSSLIQLFGDEFAQVSASVVFTLEDLTDKQGGTGLTNIGNIDLTRIEDKLPLRGYKIPTLNADGGNGQYFVMDSRTELEVGTNSFIAKIDFKGFTSTSTLFGYGSEEATKENWEVLVTSGGNWQAIVDDGTNTANILGDSADKTDDGEYHTAIMFVDKTNNLLHLYIDGNEIGNGSGISSVGDLSNTTEDFYIGARKLSGGGTSNAWEGELSNFQLYQDADANKLFNLIPILSNPQLRESACVLGGGLDVVTDSATRLNNRFETTSVFNDGDYTTCVVNTSEGLYDINSLYIQNTNFGIVDLQIDGNVITSVDGYAGSVTRNLLDVSKTFLTGGSHILKLKVNGKNTSSTDHRFIWQMVELIKRDGEYQESDEATSGILFGDELLEKETLAGSLGIDTSNAYNNQYTDATTANGEYMEGTIFVKAGTYDITMTAQQSTDYPAIDLDFGGTSVLIADTTFDGGTTANLQTTKRVYLKGGKTPVRLTVNSTTTGDALEWTSIKFEMVSGNGEGDIVNIYGADTDLVQVNNVTPVVGINTLFRFNTRIVQTDLPNSADLDEWKWRRYFSGGTYLVKWLTAKGANAPIVDWFTDGNSGSPDIFDGVDLYNATALQNQEFYTTVNVPRGFHDIHQKANSKNASSGDFQMGTQIFKFIKIGENPDPVNDDNSDDANIPVGKQIFSIPASAWKPTTTAGASGLTTRELGANNFNIEAMQFLDGSDTSVFYNFKPPENWDQEKKIRFRYIWFRENDEATPESKTVEFELKGEGRSNSAQIGVTAFNTAVGVLDTTDSVAPAEEKIMFSDWSAEVDIGENSKRQRYIFLELMRDDSAGSMTGTAYLVEVQIEYYIRSATSDGDRELLD